MSRRSEAAAAAGLLAASSLLPTGGALATKHHGFAVRTPVAPPAVLVDDSRADADFQVPPPEWQGDDPPSAQHPAHSFEADSPPPRVQTPSLPATAAHGEAQPSPEPAPSAETPRPRRLKPQQPERARPGRAADTSAEPAQVTRVRGPRVGGDERRFGQERSLKVESSAGDEGNPTHRHSGRKPPTHVVKPGECLWTIAERQLGSWASDTRVAAMVDELWRLNADRIGTGNPNLIYPDQELRLP